jgi:hypothetical protein
METCTCGLFKKGNLLKATLRCYIRVEYGEMGINNKDNTSWDESKIAILENILIMDHFECFKEFLRRNKMITPVMTINITRAKLKYVVYMLKNFKKYFEEIIVCFRNSPNYDRYFKRVCLFIVKLIKQKGYNLMNMRGPYWKRDKMRKYIGMHLREDSWVFEM